MTRLVRLGIVVALLIAACGGTGEVAGTATTTSTVATTTSTTAAPIATSSTTTTTLATTTLTTVETPVFEVPPARSATVDWQKADFDGIDGPRFDDSSQLVAGDGRFLVLEYQGRGRVVLWTSTAGTTWEAHLVVVPGGRGAPELLGEVGGQVVIRQLVYDDGAYPPDKPPVWRLFASSDLVTWTELDVPASSPTHWHLNMWTTDTAVLFRSGAPSGVRLFVGATDLTQFEVVDWPFPDGADVVATADRFYALSGGSGQNWVWSSSDGRTWVREDFYGGAIAANDEMVVVVDGQVWHVARSGQPFEQTARRLSSGGPFENVAGGPGGFVWYAAATEFGGPPTGGVVGPYVSTDGREWNLALIDDPWADGLLMNPGPAGYGPATAVVAGEWFLAPSGSWVETWDEETQSVTFSGWVADGGWVLGRIDPAG